MKLVNGQPPCTSFSRFTQFQKEYLPSSMGTHLTCIHTAESYFNKEKSGMFPLGMNSRTVRTVSIVKHQWQSCFSLLLLLFSSVIFQSSCVLRRLCIFWLNYLEGPFIKINICVYLLGKCDSGKEQVRDKVSSAK